MDSPRPGPAPLSLCSPAPELTCFGCCPPIRPSHYDPLSYVGSLRREFLENRQRLLRDGPRLRPIVGYSCWALGYLDAGGRRVGCMLHPLQNAGSDLRGLIDYGDKCRRESCVPSQMFAHLPLAGQRFWLPLARGLTAFHFSSRRSNPLFHLMLWGPEVLEPLRLHAESQGWTETELLHLFPFLLGPDWPPQPSRYLFRLVLRTAQSTGGMSPAIEGRCKALKDAVLALPLARLAPSAPSPTTPYTHQLPMERDFLDFVRLGLGRRKMPFEYASGLKETIEQTVRELSEDWERAGQPSG